jgi:poly-beta-hydroxyalkanoate depolymerase
MTLVEWVIVVVVVGHFVMLLRLRASVHALHIQINSRMDDWIESARMLARAVGVQEGIISERTRHDAKP